jgi:hypothetical protein
MKKELPTKYKEANNGGVHKSINLNMDLLNEDNRRQNPWWVLKEAYEYQLKHNPWNYNEEQFNDLGVNYMTDKMMSTFKWHPPQKSFLTRLKSYLKCYLKGKKKCQWIKKIKGDCSVCVR